MSDRTVIYDDPTVGLFVACRRGRVVRWSSADGSNMEVFPSVADAVTAVEAERLEFLPPRHAAGWMSRSEADNAEQVERLAAEIKVAALARRGWTA